MSVTVGAAVSAGGRGTALTAAMPSVPTGTLVRLVVALGANAELPSGGAVAGWVLASANRGSSTANSGAAWVYTYHRIFTGTGDTWAATLSTTTNWITAAHPVYGSDQSSPVDVTLARTPNSTVGDGVAVAPSVTPGRAGLLITTVAAVSASSPNLVSWQFPEGTTEFFDGMDSGSRISLGMGYRDVSAGSPTGEVVVAGTSANGTWAAADEMALSSVWASPPEPASANVRVGGEWLAKPIRGRVAGSWL